MLRHCGARFREGDFRVGLQGRWLPGGRRRGGLLVGVADFYPRETEPLCERLAAAQNGDGDGRRDDEGGGGGEEPAASGTEDPSGLPPDRRCWLLVVRRWCPEDPVRVVGPRGVERRREVTQLPFGFLSRSAAAGAPRCVLDDRCGPSSSARGRSRARDKRDLSVPTGQPSTSAVSASDSSSR